MCSYHFSSVSVAEWLKETQFIYYSKEVLNHLIFTTFLNNVLYKYTKDIFKYHTAMEGWSHCLSQQ